jgi:hypothetical protein
VRTIRSPLRSVAVGATFALLVACTPTASSSAPDSIAGRSPSAHPSARPTIRPKHVPTPKHVHPPPAKIHPAGVPAVDLPNLGLTPGVAFNVGVSRICVSGYASSVRNVSEAEKAQVYARYHVAWVPYQHEVDHLISLEVGGSNAIGNLWPEPYAGRWGARTKDVLEDRLHALVCAGQLALHAAQYQEATNWVAAYRRYVGSAPTGSGSGSGSGGTGSSGGGYYASSYPSASTIYCADDPDWKNLSSHYLVHFQTLTQARARFPGYHLHQPC